MRWSWWFTALLDTVVPHTRAGFAVRVLLDERLLHAVALRWGWHEQDAAKTVRAESRRERGSVRGRSRECRVG